MIAGIVLGGVIAGALILFGPRPRRPEPKPIRVRTDEDRRPRPPRD